MSQREIVDREDELRQLVEAAGGEPSLVVLIGRRRVGKSFLLERAFSKTRVVSFQGDEQDEAEHLKLLATEAGRSLLGTDTLRFDTWDAALDFFAEQARRERLTVILDEFQWLKRAQPALDSILQRHWDQWDRQKLPITLVLSGSALTMMEKMLEQGAPLYGRANARPRLLPFDYRWAADFVNTTDPETLLRRWAVIGGTPQYQIWAGDNPLDEIIAQQILTKGAPLYDDPRHLLRESEGIRDPGTYLSIMRVIAAGATRHNEIAQRSGAVVAGLKERLDRLEDLGYVERRYPVTPDDKEQRPGYHVADPYFRFWFRYIAGNRSRLERGRTEEVLTEILADLDNTMGWAFEQCCRRWVGVYADESKVGAAREIGSWWSRDGQTEIDVAGVARSRYVLVGSCKWRRVGTEHDLDQLQRAQSVLGGKAVGAKQVIFARDGFTDKLRERAELEDVLLVNAAQLFASAK